jgi:hypothetical protein
MNGNVTKYWSVNVVQEIPRIEGNENEGNLPCMR